MTEKRLRLQRILKLAAIVILVPVLIVSLWSIVIPATSVNDVIDSKIDHSSTVKYEALMKRSLLYPEGGKTAPEGSLIAKITDALIFTIESSIASDQPVKVEGTGKCVIRILAEDMWERDFIASSSQEFIKNTSDDVFYTKRMTVYLSGLDEYIKKIEDETGIMPERYIISLAPDIAGNMTCLGNTFPLEPIPAIKLSYGGGMIRYLAETGPDGLSDDTLPMVTTKTFTVSHTDTTINTLFGAGIPIPVARMIFIPLALLLGGYVGYRPLAGLLAAKSGLSPATRINRKYKNRIVRIMAYPKPTAKAAIEFHSFQEMVHMADQKELPILCYDGGGDIVDYFLIDNGAVYSFKADNHPAAASQSVLPQPAAGKSEQTDA